MLNQIILVGRIAKDIETTKLENGLTKSIVSLVIPRSFKNSEGHYDNDFVNCVLLDNIAKNTCEYCKKGDIVGIKGRVQSRKIEEENETNYVMEIIAEKVTFLSSNSKEKDKEV